jgi:hypothetical protein
MKKIILIIAVLFCASRLEAIMGDVFIKGGASEAFCLKVANSLTEIVNLFETGTIESARAYFTIDGFSAMNELLQKTSLVNANPVQETKILTLPHSGYEVRNIRVKVKMGDTQGLQYQNLVFSLNKEGLICDVRFSMELSHYQDILEEGEQLKDLAIRQQIVQFIEIYRTAHNRKDIDYIRQIYSDNALIIVGRVVKVKPDVPDMLNNSYLNQYKIEFIRKSKTEYIRSLENVFQLNSFVDVTFDSIGIIRHDTIPKLYGVTLLQEWRSSSYSDTGWVFLLIDYRDENQPIIHIRAWQPEKFPDGSVIGLYDFKPVQ